jgi:hypothetical protein
MQAFVRDARTWQQVIERARASPFWKGTEPDPTILPIIPRNYIALQFAFNHLAVI